MSEIIGGFIAGVLMCPLLMYGFVWIVERYDEWRFQWERSRSCIKCPTCGQHTLRRSSR